jgi:carboxylesterase
VPVPVERVVPGPGEVGCLLVHGLTGTPEEMVPVAEILAGRYPLWLARVAGHATSVADLAATSWPQWYTSVAAGADALLRVAPRIVVVGLSMGALLGMRLAVERGAAIAGLALLSPAVALRRPLVRWLAPPLRALGAADARWPRVRLALAPIAVAKSGSDIADPGVRRTHPGYRRVPLRALLNLLALQRLAWRDAPAIVQPTLVVHAVQDHTCPVGAARALHHRLGSPAKRLVLLEESFHVVTVDRERPRVLAEIEDHVAVVAGARHRQPVD